MLASALLALLRYGLGSLFVVGESVASALLRSTGADIAGTLERLHVAPLWASAEAAAGLLLAAAAANLVMRQPALAAGLAAASSAEAWWFGFPLAAGVLAAAAIAALPSIQG